MKKYTGYKGFIVFSVFQSNMAEAYNINKTQSVLRDMRLAGVRHKEATGVYKGIQEMAIITDSIHECAVINICAQHNQECYLYVDENRNSYLKYPHGETYLGKWHSTSKLFAGDAYAEVGNKIYRAG